MAQAYYKQLLESPLFNTDKLMYRKRPVERLIADRNIIVVVMPSTRKDCKKESLILEDYADEQYKKLLNEIDQYVPQDDFCVQSIVSNATFLN